MILHLSCQSCGIGLDLPATPAEVADRLSTLREGLETTAPVQISGVDGPIPNLLPYIQNADPESESDLQKLNALAEKISGMSRQEQRIFSGVLDAESINGLDDVLRAADSLGRYELIEGVTSDRALGGWLVEHDRLEVKFPKEVQPYLDYAAIGAEYYANHGGIYTPGGYMKRRDAGLELTEETGVLRLILSTGAETFSLDLPVSDERLEQVKAGLGLDDFAQAEILRLEAGPDAAALGYLLPMDCIAVEDANELASCVEQMTEDELKTYFSALLAEAPGTFPEARNIAMDIDDYESVSDNEWEYGREFLRRIGADDELLDTIDGYINFGEFGKAMMEEDGVRQTEFGSVRRLSQPFPEQSEMGQQML